MRKLNPKTLTAALAVAVSVALPAAAQDASGPILFTNVNVFDGVNEALITNANVVVTDNLITAVSTEPLAVAGGRVIDGGGRTLMPGLIEGHAHIMLHTDPVQLLISQDTFEQGARAAKRANDYLMSGFTTVRDMGGNCFGVKRAIDADVFSGPRIYCGGAGIGQTSGHGDFRMPSDGHPVLDGPEFGGTANRYKHTLIADGADDVRRTVRELLFRGASHIKILAGGGVTSFTDPLQAAQYTHEELKAAVEEATRYGTYVTVHAQLNNSVSNALDAGVRVIEHGLVLEEDTVKRMKELGVFYSPQAFLPLQDVSGNPQFQAPIQQAKLAIVAEGTRNAFDLARKYELKILWGTDVFGSDEIFKNFTKEFAFRDEFWSPIEQMQQVTGNNAQVLALSGLKNPYPDAPLGVIQSGAYADIILVNGDPTTDIKLLMDAERNIDLIMKDGVIYKNTVK
ncbi:metal-dependent hydrolase family protein [Shimia aestuarii]|uniref:Imidazolonepropionase n=1 Tax=Shimia aestuarii TaxID=254406 RepID=A0A1I4IQD9_9RHOB|nr:amidohydrolase family protein [Shimia aestuarii]SFL56572.1 Imidazolonepropionase [Shimia aestuarii]